MTKKFYIITLLIVVSLSIVAVSCKKTTAPTDPKVLSKVIAGTSELFKGEDGKKMYNSFHKKHDEGKVSCIKCHHKFSNDDRMKKCADCHVGTEKEVLAPCITCHTARNK